jgi:hypothetical protein
LELIMDDSSDEPNPVNASSPIPADQQPSGNVDRPAAAATVAAAEEHQLPPVDSPADIQADPAAPPEPDLTALGALVSDNAVADAMSMSPDALSHIDQTLDQLVSSTDLFDVPVLDSDGTT